jgi:hypothetical protein
MMVARYSNDYNSLLLFLSAAIAFGFKINDNSIHFLAMIVSE